ncbi:MAG TPA: DUF4340 domain-containing protein [Clostridiales bacterium]|nr:DUF4340 domain-containing protein [Clostridiales bacterium]
MRRKRSLIILLAVLVLLSGTYVFLVNRPQKEEPDESKPVIEISKFDREKIVRMTIKNSNIDELVFETETRIVEEDNGENGEDSEPKEEKVWVTRKPYPVELIQTKVTDLARTFSSLTADQIVEEEPEDLSIYGLDKPSATGTAELDDGTKVTLFLGNKTAEGSTYYLMKDGDPKVYTVRSMHGERLNSPFSNFREKSLKQIDLMTMKYLYISGEGRREIEIVSSDDIPNKEDAYGFSAYYMIKPYKRPRGIDSTKLGEKFESGLAGLVIKDFADDNPTDLAKYGLDNPKLHFVIRDENNTLDLSFGKSLDDGTIYFKTGDSDAVYLMDESSISFLDFKPLDITDKFALLVNIEDVDKVVVEGRGRKHTLSITRTVKKAEKEGEEDETIATYFLDGKEVEEDLFKDFYQSIIGIIFDTEKAHTAQGTPDLQLTYYLNKGEKRQVSVAFYPYDDDFYSVVRDGDMESEFLVYKNRLNWVFEDLEGFLAGKIRED